MKTRRGFLQDSATLSAGLFFLPAIPSLEAFAPSGKNLEEFGLVDVTVAPFLADATGKTDCTGSLQKAIDYARDHRMAAFFPAGVYRVTDTLTCRQKKSLTFHFPENERYNPAVLIGSRAGSARPRIVLAPGSPGFGNPSQPKFFIHYLHDGPKPGSDQTASAYNDMFIGIDLEIGEGNPGAVALRMQAAQGSTIQDSVIHVGDGLTGIEGGNGSGGSNVRVTVIGGKIGLDLRNTQPTPTITGITLLHQTETAIWHAGEQTLAATGIRIVSKVPGPLIRAEDPQAYAKGQGSDWSWFGSISLVDSEIIFESTPGVAISSTSAVYLNHVYVRGASSIVKQPDADDLKGNPGGWMLVREFARGYKRAPFENLHFTDPVYVDGAKVAAVVDTVSGTEPPDDLQSRHTWDDSFPSWEDPKAANVRQAPYGAVGDGKADDTDAIQRAIDEKEIVFLPKGIYRITKTIDLRPNTKLLGLSGPFCILQADEKAFGDGNNPMPVLRTADDAKAETVIAFICTWPQSPGAFNLHWRSGRKSINRSMVTGYGAAAESFNYPRTKPSTLVTGNGGGRWYNWYEGTHYKEFTATYRHLLVEGTREPFRVYMFNPEHPRCDMLTEFRDTRYVSLYGVKAEGNYPVITVKDSDNFRLFGYGGNADPFPNMALFNFENTPNFLVADAFERMRAKKESGSGVDRVMDPTTWRVLIEHLPNGTVAGTGPMERPVLYKRGNPVGGFDTVTA